MNDCGLLACLVLLVELETSLAGFWDGIGVGADGVGVGVGNGVIGRVWYGVNNWTGIIRTGIGVGGGETLDDGLRSSFLLCFFFLFSTFSVLKVFLKLWYRIF